MWHASSTRFAPAAEDFLVATRLPIGSVTTESNRPFISCSRIARTRSSRPATPGVSDSTLSRARFMYDKSYHLARVLSRNEDAGARRAPAPHGVTSPGVPSDPAGF